MKRSLSNLLLGSGDPDDGPGRLLAKKDRWGNGLGLWVLVVMVFLLPLAWQSIQRVSLENNVKNWLPKDDPQSRVLDWYEQNFSLEDRILVSWEESAVDDPRVDLFARRLEGFLDEQGIRRDGSDYVESVVTPNEALERMERSNVPRDEALERLVGVTVGRGPLRLKYTEKGLANPPKTASLVAERLKKELGIDVEVLDPAEDYTDWELPLDVAERVAQWPAPPGDDSEDEEPAVPGGYDPPYTTFAKHDARLTWRSMHSRKDLLEQVEKTVLSVEDRGEPLVESAFFTPGSPVAIVGLLTKAGREDRDAMIAEIRGLAHELGIPPESLHLGGGPYAGNELNRFLSKVVWNDEAPSSMPHERSPFLASLVVGVILAFLMLRSIRLTILVILTAFYTMFVTVALVPATGGSMNVVLVVMPTLLVVLTLSASIHLCSYWRFAVANGSPRPVLEAANLAFRPCLFAALTTAIGLVSLRTSPLAPVADFGFYSAVGCLISLHVVVLGLPAMMLTWRGTPPASGPASENATWAAFGRILYRHSAVVLLGCLALFVGCVAGLQYFRTETKVIRYFPEETRVVQDYLFLEDTLAGIIPVEVVIRFDDERVDSDSGRSDSTKSFYDRLEVVRRVQERIAQHPDISGTVSIGTFLAPTAPKPEKPGVPLALWQRRSNKFERELKSFVTGDEEQEFLDGRDPESLNTEDAAELRAIRRRQKSIQSYFNVAQGPSDVPDAGTGGELEIREGDELWRISASVAIMTDLDYGALVGDQRRGQEGELNALVQEELRLHPSAKHMVSGMVPFFLRTQQAVLDSLITSFTLAFAIIAIVMMLLLRSPLSGAMAMIPNLLPVGVVFGLVAWAGIPVDIGTMITASVALGIAVDGTLHLVTWFQEAIRRGCSREQAVAEALSHCGPAMFQTSAVVGVGLLVLASADLLLVHRFGWLMASLIGTALIADVVLLPALLAGPLGKLVENSTRANAERGELGENATADNAPHELHPHLPPAK